jgi:serine/arginine repetitive matrix protein 1
MCSVLGFVFFLSLFGPLNRFEQQFPDPKKLQVNITGFLATDASDFVSRLWNLLLSAQSSLGGIPPELLEQKKREILRKKAEQERIRLQLGKKMDKVK